MALLSTVGQLPHGPMVELVMVMFVAPSITRQSPFGFTRFRFVNVRPLSAGPIRYVSYTGGGVVVVVGACVVVVVGGWVVVVVVGG